MSPLKSPRVFLLVAFVLLIGLGGGVRLVGPAHHGFVSVAEAVVGRPLTPVSVAGVARRSARRCEAGVTC
jgi:hypothetical protein